MSLTYKLEREKVFSVIAVAAALLYTSYELISISSKEKKREIPMHKSSYPYFGHLLSLGNAPNDVISKWHEELGPIIKIKMGAQTWISIDDPRMIHQLLVLRGVQTSDRPKSFFGHTYSLGGKGMIFSAADQAWKKVRTGVSAAISASQINRYMDSIEYEAKELVNRLIESTKKENGVYPFENLEFYVANTISIVAFGRNFKTMQDPDFREIIDILSEGISYSGIEYNISTYLPIFSVLEYISRNKIRKIVHERRDPIYRRMIKEAMECENYNFIKYLRDNNHDLSDDEILVAASDLVGAGTDTTSVTLTCIFAIMCNHPGVQLKVQEEIDRFIKSHDRLPTIQDKIELPYCVSVIKESLRHKPPVAFGVPHVVKKDLPIDGYIIEKGSVIITNNVTLHKNTEFFPDMPESFIPERYMNNQKSMQAAVNGKFEERDHFAFGWGRRICPGISLAEAEIFSGFVNVFSRCSIEPTEEGMPDITKANIRGLTLAPSRFKVNFIERTNTLIKSS